MLRWRWLDDVLLPLLVVTLRLCWLWPWQLLLQVWLAPDASRSFVPLWVLFALMLGGTIVARLALARSGSLSQARRWVSGIGLLALVVLLWWQYGWPRYAPWELDWVSTIGQSLADWQATFPPALVTLAFAVGAWLRGVLDARHTVQHEDVQRSFVHGCIAFGVLLFVAPHDGSAGIAHLAWWLMAFFAVSMAALALASLELSLITGRAEKEAKVRLNRYWLAIVLSVIGGLLAIGLLISALVAPETILSLLGWTRVLLDLLWSLVGIVLFVIAYILFFLADPLIAWLRERMAGMPPPQPIEATSFQRQLDKLMGQPGADMPPYVVEALRWLVVMGTAVAIGLLFALALRYLRDGKDEEIDETRESIFSREMVGAQLTAALNRWRKRFRRSSSEVLDPFLPLAQEEANRRQIRRIYQSFLALAGMEGRARLPAQTPTEYAASLGEGALPREAPLAIITAAYNQARYAAETPSVQQVEQAQNAWLTLERDLLPPED